MTIAHSMLAEFDHEMANTRKVLALVPEAALDWKPHEKSWSLGGLATHLVNMPRWMQLTLTGDGLDLGSMPPTTPFSSSAALLAAFDERVTVARALLAATSDDAMRSTWTLRMGERVMFTMPRIAVLRTSVFNHMIHHRGQLTVYLRLQDVPLPDLYGPTADTKRG